MKNYSFYIISGIFVNLLSGCAITKQTAPIEYHHQSASSNYYHGNEENTVSVISNDDDDEMISSVQDQDSDNPELIHPASHQLSKPNNAMPAKIAKPVLPNQDSDRKTSPIQENDKIIKHIVKEDETIEDVASYYGQKPQDIAELNELSPPFQLDEFQILKIRVPKNFAPKTGLITKIQQEPIKQLRPVSAEYIKPTDGTVITKFGQKTDHGTSKGINIAAPEGTKVIATSKGKVIYADYDATFGNLIIVKMDNKNTVISYAHLADLSVKKGTILNQGDLIGYVGKTGKVTAPQLHFAIREGKTAVDPLKFVHYNN